MGNYIFPFCGHDTDFGVFASEWCVTISKFHVIVDKNIAPLSCKSECSI